MFSLTGNRNVNAHMCFSGLSVALFVKLLLSVELFIAALSGNGALMIASFIVVFPVFCCYVSEGV